ncbi:MAG: hypothetical protein AMXMBFR84_16490 [Candidatus Hydrogenedentota bacterium]
MRSVARVVGIAVVSLANCTIDKAHDGSNAHSTANHGTQDYDAVLPGTSTADENEYTENSVASLIVNPLGMSGMQNPHGSE